ncbi:MULTISPECIES: hypothetical protein [unclassified Rhodosalinus]|uniref:hypothetical protein n=1 Tax=unclassified Rhodosalinus TaxID=2630183 RepID=UPI0035269F61
MAYRDAATSRTATGSPRIAALRRIFDTPFDARTRELAARVARLRALSDAELAEIGLHRDDILRHVFSRTWN